VDVCGSKWAIVLSGTAEPFEAETAAGLAEPDVVPALGPFGGEPAEEFTVTKEFEFAFEVVVGEATAPERT
jgi:hypothetical protein